MAFAEALRKDSFTALFQTQNVSFAAPLHPLFLENHFLAPVLEKNLTAALQPAHPMAHVAAAPQKPSVKKAVAEPVAALALLAAQPRAELHTKRFQELLEEYNQTSRKKLTTSFRASQQMQVQNPELVQRIELPEIPGKILRPLASRA